MVLILKQVKILFLLDPNIPRKSLARNSDCGELKVRVKIALPKRYLRSKRSRLSWSVFVLKEKLMRRTLDLLHTQMSRMTKCRSLVPVVQFQAMLNRQLARLVAGFCPKRFADSEASIQSADAWRSQPRPRSAMSSRYFWPKRAHREHLQ